MFIDEIRKMKTEVLLDELDDLKEQLRQYRFEKAMARLENPNMMRYTRRDIARVKLVLRERQIAAEREQKASVSNDQ
ncbi:MAG: 50S ribosomal protein L29 [Phototrophicaceae bacterium]|jgi:large subunit ribosomal protein L29